MTLDPELVKILRCPLTKTPLRLSEDGQWLIADAGKLRYPIVDGIPRLVAEAADELEETP